MSLPISPGAVEAQFRGRVGALELDVDIRIAGTGLTALTGPSGSGKSSLVRCLAGLLRLPGRLSVGGTVWQDAGGFTPPHKRGVGMVFQDASLLPHLSVRENLRFGLRRAPPPHAIAWDDVVEWLGLEPLLARGTQNLSGGERQRVALGRALLSQPKLLLMDEPLSSLDVASKAEIMPYLERLHRSLAIPVVYVTHDRGEIDRLADEVLVMNRGRITESANAAQSRADARDAAARRLVELSPEAQAQLALAALVAGIEPPPATDD